MSPSAQQQARRQQKVEELCAATLRALTGDAALHYRGRRLYRGDTRLAIHAPHLRIDPAEDDFADCRAAADGMALRLLHSDAALHRSLCPPDPVERLSRGDVIGVGQHVDVTNHRSGSDVGDYAT